MMRAQRPTEEQIHSAVADWLRLSPLRGDWLHIPNGGARDARTGARLKAMGTRAGAPDLMFFGMPSCQLAFVELKRRGERTSDAQRQFAARCEALRVPYHVVASDDPSSIVDALHGFLRAWGALPCPN